MLSDNAFMAVRSSTPPTLASLRAHREEILAIAARRGISNIRVFGSVARGDAGLDSDIDLLVDAEPDLGFRYYGFAVEVEELLGRSVEVIERVPSSIRASIESEAVPL